MYHNIQEIFVNESMLDILRGNREAAHANALHRSSDNRTSFADAPEVGVCDPVTLFLVRLWQRRWRGSPANSGNACSGGTAAKFTRGDSSDCSGDTTSKSMVLGRIFTNGLRTLRLPLFEYR